MKLSFIKPIIAASLALGALAFVPATAQELRLLGTPRIQTTLPNPMPVYRGKVLNMVTVFRCDVRGEPSEFPKDITIWHLNGYTVPAGTQVRWTVPSTGATGVAVTPSMAPGTSMMARNVLPRGLPATTYCTAVKI